MFAIESFAIETNVLTGELIRPLFGDLLSISNDHSIHSNISSYNSAIFSEEVFLSSDNSENRLDSLETQSDNDRDLNDFSRVSNLNTNSSFSTFGSISSTTIRAAIDSLTGKSAEGKLVGFEKDLDNDREKEKEDGRSNGDGGEREIEGLKKALAFLKKNDPLNLPGNIKEVEIEVETGKKGLNRLLKTPNFVKLLQGFGLNPSQLKHQLKRGEVEIERKKRFPNGTLVELELEGEGGKIEVEINIKRGHQIVQNPLPPGCKIKKRVDDDDNDNERVELGSGTLLESHSLVSYSTLGEDRALNLTYDSGRAFGQPIFGFARTDVEGLDERHVLMGKLIVGELKNQSLDSSDAIAQSRFNSGKNYWSIDGNNGRVDAAIQAELENLATGVYNYELTSSIMELDSDGGEIKSNGETLTSSGKFVHVNTIDSVFGSGWSLDEVHHLVENDDGSVLLVEGDGCEMLYQAPLNEGEAYISASGDFSSLERMSDGTFRRTTTDRTVYKFDEENRLVSVSDRNGNETRHIYNDEGELVKIVDPVGLETSFTYSDGKVTQIADPTGRITQFEYDEAGNLVKITDPDGTSRQFEYDDRLMVAEVDKRGNREALIYDEFGRVDRAVLKNGGIVDIDPVQVQGLYAASDTDDPFNAPDAWTGEIGVASYTDAVGNITLYNLDRSGQLVSATDEIGHLRSVERNEDNLVAESTTGRGYISQYTYDDNGNLLNVQDEIDLEDENSFGLSYTYDPIFNQLTSRTDELGRQILYDIDPLNGNVLSETKVVGEIGGDDDVITSYTYTDLGLIDLKTDPNGRITDYDYDSYGRLTRITYAKGTSDRAYEEFEYDSFGNQTALIDENGNRTEYEYDEMNRVVRVTYAVGTTDEVTESLEYDSAGNVVAKTDGLGNRTEYDYDDMDWLMQTVSPDPDGGGALLSPIRTSTYDLRGNLISSKDPLGRETRYVYDERNRLIQTINPDGSIEESKYDLDGNEIASIDANGNQTKNVYDARGQLISIIDAHNNTTYFEFDVANQMTGIIEANGNLTEYEYDDLGRKTAKIEAANTADTTVIRTEYDKVGNVIAEIDSLGNKTKYKYDNRDRQIQVIDAEDGIKTTEYDRVGNILAITDPIGNTTTFNYDSRNRLVSDTNELGYTRSFTYDLVGNQTFVSDRNGKVRQFNYDNLYRQTEEIWLDAANSPVHTIEYTYDAASQLIGVSDSISSYTTTYDLLGRQATVDNAGTPNAPNVVLGYTYDKNGNLLQVKDSINGVASGVTNYIYDERDLVKSIIQTGNGVADKQVNFSYNSIGQYDTVTRYADLNKNQLVAQSGYTYDGLNRLLNLTHSNSTDTIAFYDLLYDSASRIEQITDVDGTTVYSYDGTDQLIGADRSDPNNPDELYSYDANGNRINSSLHDSGYVTGTNNQLLSDGNYNYEYDNEGNLIRQTEIATGAVRELEWDYRNRLIAVVDKDLSGVETQRVEFTYDAMDRRIAKTVDTNPLDNLDGVVTHFVYDRDNVLLEFVDDNVDSTKNPMLQTRYLHGTETDQVLAREDSEGNVIWYLTDHLGTIRDLVDNSGTVLNHISYDSFGNVIDQTNPTIETRYLFTGREFDLETGLYYYRARYYNPSIGKFISEDPIGFEAKDTNLYRYVGNRPIDTVDPSGATSTELIALLNIAQPRTPGSSIYRYPQSPDYGTALTSATTWFYLITDSSNRQARTFSPGTRPFPWLLFAPLKGPAGKGTLRPAARSGLEPTIDLQKDSRGRHNTPGVSGITE